MKVLIEIPVKIETDLRSMKHNNDELLEMFLECAEDLIEQTILEASNGEAKVTFGKWGWRHG